MTHTEIRRISLEGIYNTRDLGGLMMKDGRRIKNRRLIRSGQLGAMTSKDKTTLTDTYGLRNIIDFRTENEQNENPDPALPGVRHISNPILDEMTAGITHDKQSDRQMTLEEATITMKDRGYDPSDYMKQMYMDIITSEYSLGQYRKFFDFLESAPEGSVLWHCSAGKDRVGIGTALLLYVLGADMDLIVADYLMTEVFLRDEVDRFIAMISPKLRNAGAEESIRICMGVDEAYIQSVFQTMKDAAGSTDQFLADRIGLSGDKIHKLKALYLE